MVRNSGIAGIQIILRSYFNTGLSALRAEPGPKGLVELWYSRKLPGQPVFFRQK
jgi:hypothetical protein